MQAVNILFVVILSFIFNIVLVFIVVKIRLKHLKDRKINPHWQWLVDKFGLEVVGGEPLHPDKKWLGFVRAPLRLEGTYNNFFLKIYNYTVGSGKNRTTYSTARIIGPNPGDLRFEFHREGLFSKIGKVFGMQDIQTGDTRFDGKFIIKCNDPEFIKIALLPQIKELFYGVWETHKSMGHIKLLDEELCYDEMGTIRNEKVCERFAAVVDLLTALRGTIEFYNQKAKAIESE